MEMERMFLALIATALLSTTAAQAPVGAPEAAQMVAPPPTNVVPLDGGGVVNPLDLAPAALSPPIVPPPTPTIHAYMGSETKKGRRRPKTAWISWNSYGNRDYYGTMQPIPMVAVMDTGAGLTVTGELECIAACHSRALQGCNSMSYYGNMPLDSWPGGNNCYPKRIAACNIPPDALVKSDGRKFIVKSDPTCIPPPGTTPMAFAPIIIAPPPPPPPPPGTPVLVPRDRDLPPDEMVDDPFVGKTLPNSAPVSAGATAALAISVIALAVGALV